MPTASAKRASSTAVRTAMRKSLSACARRARWCSVRRSRRSSPCFAPGPTRNPRDPDANAGRLVERVGGGGRRGVRGRRARHPDQRFDRQASLVLRRGRLQAEPRRPAAHRDFAPCDGDRSSRRVCLKRGRRSPGRRRAGRRRTLKDSGSRELRGSLAGGGARGGGRRRASPGSPTPHA